MAFLPGLPKAAMETLARANSAFRAGEFGRRFYPPPPPPPHYECYGCLWMTATGSRE
jgi:hypothetical protein